MNANKEVILSLPETTEELFDLEGNVRTDNFPDKSPTEEIFGDNDLNNPDNPVHQNPEQAVVVTIIEADGTRAPRETVMAPERVAAAKAAAEADGNTIVVETISASIRSNLEELNTESEAKTTLVRLYDENGTLVDQRHVEDTMERVNTAIKFLANKHGLNVDPAAGKQTGFALVTDTSQHMRLIKGTSEVAQLYKAVHAERKRIRQGRRLMPGTPIGRSTRKFLQGTLINTKRTSKVITLQMLLDRRADGEYIYEQMSNLVQRNNDPAVWAELALVHPEIESETAEFAKWVDEKSIGNLGLADGESLFQRLVEQPVRYWGVSTDSLGNPSSSIVEVQKTDGGWKTVQGKAIHVFTEETASKLERKLNNASSTKQYNRYGKEVSERAGTQEVNWEVRVEMLEPGVWVIAQEMKTGIDSARVFDQIREIQDRGDAVRTKGTESEYAQFRLEFLDPDTNSRVLHLGEITKLGRMQRYGKQSLMLGTQLTQAHQNFLYGLSTLLGMGYTIPGAPSIKPDANLATKVRGDRQLGAVLKNKIIYGNITFDQSLGSQEWLAGVREQLESKVVTEMAEIDTTFMPDPPRAGMTTTQMVDFLLDVYTGDANIEAAVAAAKSQGELIEVGTETKKKLAELVWLSGQYDQNFAEDLSASVSNKESIVDYTDPAASFDALVGDYKEVIMSYDQAEVSAELDFHEKEELALDKDTALPNPKRPPRRAQHKVAPNVFIGKEQDQVTSAASNWEGIAAKVTAALGLLNIKEKIVLFDEKHKDWLRDKYERIAADVNTTEEQRTLALKYVAFIEGVKDTDTGKIFFSDGNFSDRVVLIYVTNKRNATPRGWVLAHELGHLVQYTYLERLSPQLQKEFLEEMAPDLTGQPRIEAFANWMATHLALETEVADVNDTGLPAAFKTLVQALRTVYEWAFKTFGKAEASARTFQQFVSALNTHLYHKNDPLAVARLSPLGKKIYDELHAANAGPYITINRVGASVSANYTETVEDRSKESLFQKYWDDFANLAQRYKDKPKDAALSMFLTADGELRSMGEFGTYLADLFHALPVSTTESETVFRQIQQDSAEFHKDMSKILAELPGASIPFAELMFNKRPTAKMKAARELRNQINEALLLHTRLEDITNPEVHRHVVKLRHYMNTMHGHLKSSGLSLKLRQNYWPLMMDTEFVTKNPGLLVDILMKHEFSRKDAVSIRETIMRDEDGGLSNGFNEQTTTDEGQFFGPGASFAKSRADWSLELRKDLVDAGFYQKDIATTMLAYTSMATRRAVWQGRFGQPMDGVSPKGTPMFDEGTWQKYQDAGVNIHSPIAKLLLEVEQAYKASRINKSQRDRILTDILPAYAGQLGLRTHPTIRRVSSLMVIYQNIRLLAFAVFSSYVDVGTLISRGGFKDFKAAMNGMLDGATRKEAYEMLQDIGAMREGLAEFILNDQSMNTFMTGRAKRINDMFFKYNQMEGWTNMMRAMALISGRSFLLRNAASNSSKSQRYLAELGITKAEVMEWGGDGVGSARIKAALNRYIDESMIRPDASIRPVWMSDPGYALFSHLKSFLYGFHETFLRRVWREATIHHNLLPMFMLGMLALPFAAVGYELRRFITGADEKTKPRGADYLLEVIERAGLPGAFQLIVDMEQSAEFGKPFGLGIAGPATEQLYDLFTSDMGTLVPKAIPIVAQSPYLREQASHLLED
jgi:hypothetical protein